MASYGAVAVSDLEPGGSQTWQPKQVFHAIAEDSRAPLTWGHPPVAPPG